MKRYIKAAKESSNGIFWVIDDEEKLLAYPFGTVDSPTGIAKSGDTYNHKRLWNDLHPAKGNKTYNYSPRRRVDWDSQGRATIYMNPNIDDSWISEIKKEFGILPSDDVRVSYDYSDHYKCHLDDGWKAEK